MKPRWAWHDFFEKYDLLLTPICSTTAFPHDHSPFLETRTLCVNGETSPYFEQLFWSGLTGVPYLPSTVFPTGADESGLPIGVQGVGPEYGDFQAIHFADLLSEKTGGFQAPPAFSD